ncbi:MAG: 2-amino-4-hydroxy-6-hydroxymethyldihydropteridine diphosphokinase [Mariniblastus sp.]|nr:2-amino-4-hydroxy-6-hydroxymethyldihydropteridine diphosphokinase [Mariniblastus sp.]
MPDCLISFGSNLGDRSARLSQVTDLLQAVPGVRRVRVSQPLETLPVGGPPGQAPYLNAAIRCVTKLPAVELHQKLLGIEADLGRVRRERWGSRTADLDLLLYDQQRIESEALTIPHPRMACRRFVLQPSVEIAGEMKHPLCGCTIEQLLGHLDRRSNRIVVVGHEPRPGGDWFDQLARSFENRQIQLAGRDTDEAVELDPGQWQVIWRGPTDAHRALETAKLLVLCHQPGGVVPSIEFEGARLHLPHLDLAAMRLEIAAAIEGMLPLSPSEG